MGGPAGRFRFHVAPIIRADLRSNRGAAWRVRLIERRVRNLIARIGHGPGLSMWEATAHLTDPRTSRNDLARKAVRPALGAAMSRGAPTAAMEKANRDDDI
jgi:hypothetical protein